MLEEAFLASCSILYLLCPTKFVAMEAALLAKINSIKESNGLSDPRFASAKWAPLYPSDQSTLDARPPSEPMWHADQQL